VHSHIWPAVTMPVLMVIANASLVFWIVRAGADIDSALVAAAGWVLVLVAVIVLGGWTALGFLLGFSYAVQIAPTIYAAYRSELPTGIARALGDGAVRDGTVDVLRLHAARAEHLHLRHRRRIIGRGDTHPLGDNTAPPDDARAELQACQPARTGVSPVTHVDRARRRRGHSAGPRHRRCGRPI